MSRLIDSALSSVMAVRTDPSSTLANASKSFNISGALAEKIKNSLEKSALLKYKQQEAAYQNQVALLQKEDEMRFRVQLQQAGFAQQQSLANKRFGQQQSLANKRFAQQQELANNKFEREKELAKDENKYNNERDRIKAQSDKEVAKINAIGKVASANIRNADKNIKSLKSMFEK